MQLHSLVLYTDRALFVIMTSLSHCDTFKLPPSMVQLYCCMWSYRLCLCHASISCLLPHHQEDAWCFCSVSPHVVALCLCTPVRFSSVMWICMQSTPKKRICNYKPPEAVLCSDFRTAQVWSTACFCKIEMLTILCILYILFIIKCLYHYFNMSYTFNNQYYKYIVPM